MREIRVIPLSARPALQTIMAASPDRFPVLLQSSRDEGWDLLLAATDVLSIAADEHVLAVLNRVWAAVDPAEYTCLPNEAPAIPFKGGWFVYCGYELLHAIEPSVPPFEVTNDFPADAIYRTPAAIVTRRSDGASWLLVEPGFDALCDELLAAIAAEVKPIPALAGVLSVAEEVPDIYLGNIAKVKDYIREGDVFQVNLSRRWTANLSEDFQPQALFASLRAVNPAPFSGLVRLPAKAGEASAWVISASPERLISVALLPDERSGQFIRHAETRPIAGTHPRSQDVVEDEALKQQLLASRKERAEHVMLVDLERNDLGRVCVPGSVKVDELMAVATYSYVHHIESNVHGVLRPEVLPGDAIRAMFPGGTITGCPKVRTMQIIRELETHPRYAYTGSMGYVNRDGSMDMNILIRTFMYNPALKGEELVFRAGGGIVIDSDPERELNETRAKVKGLLRALVGESA